MSDDKKMSWWEKTSLTVKEHYVEPLGEFFDGMRKGKPVQAVTNYFYRKETSRAEFLMREYRESFGELKEQNAALNKDLESNASKIQGSQIWNDELKTSLNKATKEEDKAFYSQKLEENAQNLDELRAEREQMLKEKMIVYDNAKKLDGVGENALEGAKLLNPNEYNKFESEFSKNKNLEADDKSAMDMETRQQINEMAWEKQEQRDGGLAPIQPDTTNPVNGQDSPFSKTPETTLPGNSQHTPTNTPDPSSSSSTAGMFGSVLNAGKQGFGYLMSIGRGTLGQVLSEAIQPGQPPQMREAVVKGASKVVLAQMLAQVQGAMEREQDKLRPWNEQHAGRTPGYVPEGMTESLEEVFNSRHNDSIFTEIAKTVSDFGLRRGQDPLEMLVQQVKAVLGYGGFVNVRPISFVDGYVAQQGDDFGGKFPNKDKHPVPKKEQGVQAILMDVFGIKLPFELPDLATPTVLYHVDNLQQPMEDGSNPSLGISAGGVTHGGGDVSVKSYSRSTGEVKAHTRTAPDGIASNNFSFRRR